MPTHVHHLRLGQLLKQREIEMPVPHMLPLGSYISLGQKTHRLHHLEFVDVESASKSPHLRQEPATFINDAQESLLDDDGAASLLQVPKAHDVHLESWNVVHLRESLMLTRFAKEEDRAPTLNLHDKAIAELDRSMNPKVDFRERG
jgi:hypothetical protein